jgi:SAM-dependent methyltransferase
MTEPGDVQAQQIASWNGELGDYWVAQQEKLDRTLQLVATQALAVAAPQPGEHVLDVGCGCGATTLLLAEAVGQDGQVTGLDVSAPMLARAKQRAAHLPQVACVLADASSHSFATGSFNLLFSRFGVMFFSDPMAAFANLRRGLRADGRLVFACWRSLPENLWMYVPYQAVLGHVPPLPRSGPDEPGPFAFADPERVTRILTQAGFAAPRFTPLDITIDVADGGGLDAAAQQATELGVARRALENQPPDVRSAAQAAVRVALAPYAQGDTVALPGAVWLVSSQRLVD